MNVLPKAVVAITPISVTNGGTATGESIDTRGFNYCHIHVVASTANVVSNKPTVLKVQESATTDATNYADVTGLVGGTDFTVANALTSVPNGWLFGLPLKPNRKRYLRVLVSPQTTMVIGGSAILTRGEESPINATKAGVNNLVVI
jgi:hypothetical protein